MTSERKGIRVWQVVLICVIVAALTAVQKIAAGIAIAGVVTGSAAGTAIVVKNSNAKEEAASIVYTEESKVVTSSGIWEIEESDSFN